MTADSTREVRTALLAKGVAMPDPGSVYIAGDVDPDRVSGDGVTIHPGCRISGPDTVISAGVSLGAEGPVTIKNVRLGVGASIAAGYAVNSVLLEGASLGLGAHVRDACLLEEQSGGAHTVGLKQTILLPFVTLGSLINFCDCLMSGGTSRSDHSEVGSSYIHFNFTPDGDKATPSLFGDVCHGVLLDQPPVFLGGQGGTVGPVTVGFGSVIAAGSVLRSDVAAGKLVVVGPPPAMITDRTPGEYRALARSVAKNLRFLGELSALEAWHRHARAPFFAAVELGDAVGAGALEMLRLARVEREKRLAAMVGKAPAGHATAPAIAAVLEEVCRVVATAIEAPPAGVLDPLVSQAGRVGYLDAVRGLDEPSRSAIRRWLTGSLDATWERIAELAPAVARIPRTPFV
ncbi:MAG TPA: UDP-N-acetylglucosamine pyrophosphorylase [Rhodoglobus sp.]|nr:UDP-N-acetylglucosamine pyrophosphorylase [Rhodoglobus sp.]